MNKKLSRLAYSVVSRIVFESRLRNRLSLPSVRLIARETGLSNRTILSAIKEYEFKGLLRVIPRKGIVLSGGKAGAEVRRQPLSPSYETAVSRLFDRLPRRKEKQSPALHRTLQVIRKLIQETDDSGALPSIRSIAKKTGVSDYTVKKAIAVLCKQKDIVSIQGKGLYVSPHRSTTDALYAQPSAFDEREQPSDSLTAVRKWVRLKRDILHDIGAGTYLPGATLPSMKTLAHTYGTSYQPLKKALDSLECDNHITRVKRSYQIPPAASDLSSTVVLFVDAVAESLDLIQIFPTLLEVIQKFEDVCYQKRVSFSIVSLLDRHNQSLPFHKLGVESIMAKKTVLGFCFWSSRVSTDSDFIRWLLRFNRPMAVFDDIGGLDYASLLSLSGLITIYKVGTGDRAPRSVANHLLRLGHTRVAYISREHETTWSQTRYRGLVETFQQNRPDSSVYLFADKPGSRKNPIQLTISPEKYSGAIKPLLLQRIEYMIYQHLLHNAEVGSTLSGLFHLFDSALFQSDATAWITESDDTAVIALGYLREKNIRVPHQISLISFDNVFDSYLYKISSYDFNLALMIRNILDWFMNYNHYHSAGKSRRIIEVEGILQERETTGRNRKPV